MEKSKSKRNSKSPINRKKSKQEEDLEKTPKNHYNSSPRSSRVTSLNTSSTTLNNSLLNCSLISISNNPNDISGFSITEITKKTDPDFAVNENNLLEAIEKFNNMNFEDIPSKKFLKKFFRELKNSHIWFENLKERDLIDGEEIDGDKDNCRKFDYELIKERMENVLKDEKIEIEEDDGFKRNGMILDGLKESKIEENSDEEEEDKNIDEEVESKNIDEEEENNQKNIDEEDEKEKCQDIEMMDKSCQIDLLVQDDEGVLDQAFIIEDKAEEVEEEENMDKGVNLIPEFGSILDDIKPTEKANKGRGEDKNFVEDIRKELKEISLGVNKLKSIEENGKIENISFKLLMKLDCLVNINIPKISNEVCDFIIGKLNIKDKQGHQESPDLEKILKIIRNFKKEEKTLNITNSLLYTKSSEKIKRVGGISIDKNLLKIDLSAIKGSPENLTLKETPKFSTQNSEINFENNKEIISFRETENSEYLVTFNDEEENLKEGSLNKISLKKKTPATEIEKIYISQEEKLIQLNEDEEDLLEKSIIITKKIGGMNQSFLLQNIDISSQENSNRSFSKMSGIGVNSLNENIATIPRNDLDDMRIYNYFWTPRYLRTGVSSFPFNQYQDN